MRRPLDRLSSLCYSQSAIEWQQIEPSATIEVSRTERLGVDSVFSAGRLSCETNVGVVGSSRIKLLSDGLRVR